MEKKGKKGEQDLTSALIRLQALREKVKQQEEAIVKEEQLRKESENVNQRLMAEKNVIAETLNVEKGNLRKYQDIAEKLTQQKNDLERKIQDMQRRLNQGCEDSSHLLNEKSKTEEEIEKLRRNIKNIELEMSKCHK